MSNWLSIPFHLIFGFLCLSARIAAPGIPYQVLSKTIVAGVAAVAVAEASTPVAGTHHKLPPCE